MNENKADTALKILILLLGYHLVKRSIAHSLFNKSEILIQMSLSILTGSLIMHGSLPHTPKRQQLKLPTGTKRQGQEKCLNME